MERRILKGQNAKHIDRWQLEFHVEKHREGDPLRPWLPEIAMRYLRSIYPDEVIEKIVAQLAEPERGRQIVLCKSCEPFFRNGKLQVSEHDSRPSQTRLCDYVVDPVLVASGNVYERWQDHTGNMEDGEFADSPSSDYVLGRSVHEFAPAVAALNDGEEMVNP